MIGDSCAVARAARRPRAVRVAAAFRQQRRREAPAAARQVRFARSRRGGLEFARDAAFLAVRFDVGGQLRQPGFASREHFRRSVARACAHCCRRARAASRPPRDRAGPLPAGAAAIARQPARKARAPSSSMPSPAPMPDSTGSRCASDWFNASIVSRRRRLGFSQQCPSRAAASGVQHRARQLPRPARKRRSCGCDCNDATPRECGCASRPRPCA